MMNPKKSIKTVRVLRSLLFAALAVGMAACGDDGNSSDTDAAVGDRDGGNVFVCDPVGAIPAVGSLLNASLDIDVEVIVKEAQHPGDPGPIDLP